MGGKDFLPSVSECESGKKDSMKRRPTKGEAKDSSKDLKTKTRGDKRRRGGVLLFRARLSVLSASGERGRSSHRTQSGFKTEGRKTNRKRGATQRSRSTLRFAGRASLAVNSAVSQLKQERERHNTSGRLVFEKDRGMQNPEGEGRNVHPLLK